MTNISFPNKIDKLFAEKRKNILSVYFTAGFPQLKDTTSIINYLQKAGADIIEIGIPFSDPVADGPTIQESNFQALKNGISLHLIFEQLAAIKEEIRIPLIFMGYLNPIVQYGIEKFCEDCRKVGVDGLIVPDMPMQEYLDYYKDTFEKYNIHNIFLVSPQTSEERIREIDRNSKGFIYMVSSASITGARSNISNEQIEYFKRVQNMGLKNSTLIGFGISDNNTFTTACTFANGAIIGSAFINVLMKSSNLEKDIVNYVKTVKGE